MSIYETLAQSSLFHGLGKPQLKRVAGVSRFESCPPDTQVFAQGDLVSDLYIVQQGTVKLSIEVRLWLGETVLRTVVTNIQAGSAFGWSAVMEPPRAILSALTIPKTDLVAIDGRQLGDLLEADRAMGYRVMRGLIYLVASRLNATRDRVAMEQATDVSRGATPVRW